MYFSAAAPFSSLPLNYRRRRGLSATPTLTQGITSGAYSGAMLGVSTAESTGSKVAGGIAAGMMTTAGILAAVPGGQIPAAVIAGIAALVGPIANQFKGCGQTCIVTSQFANQVQDAAEQVNTTYWASPVRTVSVQKAALDAMNQLWQWLVAHCQSVGGQGGAQCVADRQRGGKYDFFSHYIDPIANDAAVVPDPVAPSALNTLASNFAPSGTLFGIPASKLLLPGLLILGAFALDTGGRK
jgi:hypothetical protein